MCCLFGDVFQAYIEQGEDMSIGQGIIDGLAVAAELDEPGIAQDAQLVGNRRLAHAEIFRNVPDADLPFHQEAQDTQPCRIAQDLKDICQRLDIFF